MTSLKVGKGMQFPNEAQKIIMVTGKGGVGKSTVAASIAEVYAKRGLKTLLVELGEHSYYQYVYRTPIHYEPTRIANNFYISLWSGERALREYVYHLLKVRKLVDLFFDNKIMRTFVRAAPALKELAVLGKITSGIRQWGPPLEFDRIVVDAFSTGHFLALLQAPIGMADLIESGPMGEQSRRIRDVIERADLCRHIVVTLPEELPVTEAIELSSELKSRYGVSADIVCNRVYETNIKAAELPLYSRESQTNSTGPFVEFLFNTLQAQAHQLSELERELKEFHVLPLIFTDNGVAVIDCLSQKLNWV